MQNGERHGNTRWRSLTGMAATRSRRRTTHRRSRGLVTVLVGIAVAIAAARGYEALAPSAAASPTPTTPSTAAPPGSELAPPRLDSSAVLGEGDGAVAAGTTASDDDVPGIAKLHPALLHALRRAAADAAADRIQLVVDSGWRSPRYQQQLLDEAIARYGSEQEAARWVATPDRSRHVSGDAVDIGRGGTAWLAKHGASYGLCRTYRNEPWHFELRPDATTDGCPRPYADAAHDPRMQGRP